MTNNNDPTVSFLLGAILAVLLFGKGAVLSGLGWLLAFVAIIGVIWLAYVLVAWIVKGIWGFLQDEFLALRDNSFYSAIIGFIGLLIIAGEYGAAYLIKGERESIEHVLQNFGRLTPDIYLWNLPLVLILASFFLGILEKAMNEAKRHPNPHKNESLLGAVVKEYKDTQRL